MVPSPGIASGLDQLMPVFHEAPARVLSLDSTLGDLPLCQFQVEATQSGVAIAQVFEQYPRLPGVVLWSQGQWLGMISRGRLLECLLRPHGLQVLLPESLQVLYSYTRCEHLLLSQHTPIRVAAAMVLRRSPDQRHEPLLVILDDQVYGLLDVHELTAAYWQICSIETQVRHERLQTQMIQSEKMASLGRLVDGVAHEILDPVGFIWGNLAHVSSYTDQLLELLTLYAQQIPQLPPTIVQFQDDIELSYLREDLPRAIDSIRTGADRLKKLAASLQNFCHMDEVYPKPANLHECLDSTLLLLKSRLSGAIQIVRHYGHLPPVTCYVGQLGQVFMNILTHMINGLLSQSIDWAWTRERGERAAIAPVHSPQITITTQIRSNLPAAPSSDPATPKTEGVGRWVSIRIADNGPGLSPEHLQRFWENLAMDARSTPETTLALSYQVITARHGGKFLVRSATLPSAERWPLEPIFTSGTQSASSRATLSETTEPQRVSVPGDEVAALSPPAGVGTEFEILLPLV